MSLRRRELLGVTGGLVLGGVCTWAAQQFLLTPTQRPINQPLPTVGAVDPVHSAEEAWSRLQLGNQRFVDSRCQFRSGVNIPTHMLARDYRPYAVILACSDSRLATEMIFDERLSELFVVRQAAHLLDAGTRTSVEYAVGYLRVPLVLVLGHDQCMTLASVIGIDGPDTAAPASLERMRTELLTVIKDVQNQQGDPMHNAVVANVRSTVRQLRTIPGLRENSRLQIRGGRVSLPNGKVEEITVERMLESGTFTVAPDQEGITLAAFLRACLPGRSWSQIHGLIEGRRIRLNGELWLDPARRVHTGESVAFLARPEPRPHAGASLVIRHLDEHVVVVEKPAGLNTVRHPAERDWREERKGLSPTLEDLLPRRISQVDRRATSGRLRVVQRLDKETSGLIVFARTVQAERILGQQFHDHSVIRRYEAIAHGAVIDATIRTWLVRDRGDGRRGSGSRQEEGKEATTHVGLLESLPGGYSRIACRLETGRTHQIRIHLSERGHPICGDKVYVHRANGTVFADRSGAPRLCLHAAELGFVHPVSGETLRWEMALPEDMDTFLRCLRAGANSSREPGS